MKAGISTACFYPELTENALDHLAKWGIQTAEIFFNAFCEMEEPFARRLAAIADAGGTKVVSIHPFTSGMEPILLFSSYRRRTEDGLEMYRRFFHTANIFGAKIVVIHGAHRNYSRPYSSYFDAFGELAQLGRSMGVIVAQENVPRCISWCPDFFVKMQKYLPDAHFVLDVKQCLRSGFTPWEMAQAMGTGICHLHLSDNKTGEDCLPAGKGDMDITGFLKFLCSQNSFDGSVMQEVYCENYGEIRDLLEGYQTIHACIADIEQVKGK